MKRHIREPLGKKLKTIYQFGPLQNVKTTTFVQYQFSFL